MKHLSIGIIFSIFFSFALTTDAEARRSLSPYQKGAVTNTQKNTLKRSFRTRRPRTTRTNTTTPRTYNHTSRRVSSRQGIRTNKKTTTTQITPFQTIQSSKIPFYISAPKGFKITTDTLNWDSGNFLLTKGQSRIEVTATSKNCNGGPTFTRNCIKEEAAEQNQQLKQSYKRAEIIEHKNIFIRSQNTKINQTNAKYFLIDTGSEKILLLTFLEPQNKSIWTLKIEAPNTTKSLTSSNKDIHRIIASMFVPPAESENKNITRLRSLTQKNKITQRRKKTTLSIGSSKKFTAKEINFEIKAPTNFKQINDTLRFDNGEMTLASEDTKIKITPTTNKCTSQTYRLQRLCINKYASQEYTKNIEKFSPQILRDETILSNMTFKQTKGQKDIGRLKLLRNNQKRRKAIFTFKEPIQNHIWHIEIEAPEASGNFLNDIRKIRKTTSSIFFKE